jgi:hypothetical protein
MPTLETKNLSTIETERRSGSGWNYNSSDLTYNMDILFYNYYRNPFIPTNESKNRSTPTYQSKNTSISTNETKNNSNWVNQEKS